MKYLDIVYAMLKVKFYKPTLILGFVGDRFQSVGFDSAMNNCFVNSPKNPISLKPKYFASGETGLSLVWDNASNNYEGYPNILHGGIAATLLDGLMATTVLKATGLVGVTVESSFRWHKPIKIGSEISGYSRVVWKFGQIYKLESQLTDKNKRVLVSATGIFFLPTLKHFLKMTGSDLSEDIDPNNFFRSPKRK